MSTNDAATAYRTIWRWHFYAGLLCLPLVLWLAVTGPIYLFKPQVDAWLDHFRGFWTHRLEALATEVARGKRAHKKP